MVTFFFALRIPSNSRRTCTISSAVCSPPPPVVGVKAGKYLRKNAPGKRAVEWGIGMSLKDSALNLNKRRFETYGFHPITGLANYSKLNSVIKSFEEDLKKRAKIELEHPLTEFFTQRVMWMRYILRLSNRNML